MDPKLLNLKYVVCVCVGIFCLIYFLAVYLCFIFGLDYYYIKGTFTRDDDDTICLHRCIRMGIEPIQNEVTDEGKTCRHGLLL